MTQVQEPAAEYARRKSTPAEAPGLFGPTPNKGTVTDPALVLTDTPAVYYTHPHGQIWLGDSIVWLRSLPSESIDLAFFDPSYGIKKAEWDTFDAGPSALLADRRCRDGGRLLGDRSRHRRGRAFEN